MMAQHVLKSGRSHAFLVAVFVAGSFARAGGPPATQPTVSDIQAAIDARQFPSAVKLATRLLALHGPAAAGLSRFQITMLKGDALVGMKSIATAVSVYRSAEKETTDPHELAISKWSAELLQTAGSSVYTPKMTGIGLPVRGPFDLTKTDDKKAAFGALLDDDLSALDTKIKTANSSQSLVEIWPVLQQVVDLDDLDQIANASDEKTGLIAGSLLDHSRNLVNNVLKEYWARLGDIDTHANTTTLAQNLQSYGGATVTQTSTHKNGLTDANKSELNDMIATSKKIHQYAVNLVKLAKNQQEWSTVLSDSNRVAGRASDVLNADYGTTISQTNTTYDNGGYYNNGGYNTNIYPNTVGTPVYTNPTGVTPAPTSQPTTPPTKKKPTKPKTGG